jgi:hypothetical protein
MIENAPCSAFWNQLQVLLVALTSFTTVLTSFLAKRRIVADRRRKAWEREMRALLTVEFRRVRELAQDGIDGPSGP